MKLLFDQNLAPALVWRLASDFPGSAHVSTVGLAEVPDEQVRAFALREGFTLVTKDVDFSELGLLNGFPPKVIWLRLGNCTTQQVVEVLRRHRSDIQQFATDSGVGVLVLR